MYTYAYVHFSAMHHISVVFLWMNTHTPLALILMDLLDQASHQAQVEGRGGLDAITRQVLHPSLAPTGQNGVLHLRSGGIHASPP